MTQPTTTGAELAHAPVRPGRTGDNAERSIPTAVGRGLMMRCPNCGQGKLFSRFLKSVEHCSECGEEFHHHRADDLPPYLTIFIVGHLVVALFMGVERSFELSLLAHFLIWVPATLALSLFLMQPLKGGTIGLQWAMRMHGFSGAAEGADH